jgi:hypothetical protein
MPKKGGGESHIKVLFLYDYMLSIKHKYTHYLNIPTHVSPYKEIPYHFHIVYYINCQINPNYFDWLMNQIGMVWNNGGFAAATIYIIATISKEKQEEFIRDTLSLFPGVIIECHIENEYEYRPILKVWELGQIHNESTNIFLYFHSKGISHDTSYKSNTYVGSTHDYTNIIRELDRVKEVFTLFPKIDKVGYFAGGCGWIWFNFWYARGSYIHLLERPIRTERRHYYEDWLARIVESSDDQICANERCNRIYYKNTLDSCYGFYADEIAGVANIGNYYCPEKEAFYPVI